MHLSAGVFPVRHGGARPIFEVKEFEVLIKRMMIFSGRSHAIIPTATEMILGFRKGKFRPVCFWCTTAKWRRNGTERK